MPKEFAFEKKLEPPPDASGERAALPDSFKTDAPIKYEKAGALEIKIGSSSTVKLAYQSAEGLTENEQKAISYSVAQHPEFARQLTSFSLHDTAGHTLEIDDLLKAGCKIFLVAENPSPPKEGGGKEKMPRAGSFFPIDEGIIIIQASMGTPQAIMALLHEAGHCADYLDRLKKEGAWKTGKYFSREALEHPSARRLDDLRDYREFLEGKTSGEASGNKAEADLSQQDSPGRYLNDSLSTMIKTERDAWAYAFRKVRPFVRSSDVFTRENILAFAHRGLSGYSNRVRKFLEGDIDALLEDIKKAA